MSCASVLASSSVSPSSFSGHNRLEPLIPRTTTTRRETSQNAAITDLAYRLDTVNFEQAHSNAQDPKLPHHYQPHTLFDQHPSHLRCSDVNGTIDDSCEIKKMSGLRCSASPSGLMPPHSGTKYRQMSSRAQRQERARLLCNPDHITAISTLVRGRLADSGQDTLRHSLSCPGNGACPTFGFAGRRVSLALDWNADDSGGARKLRAPPACSTLHYRRSGEVAKGENKVRKDVRMRKSSNRGSADRK